MSFILSFVLKLINKTKKKQFILVKIKFILILIKRIVLKTMIFEFIVIMFKQKKANSFRALVSLCK